MSVANCHELKQKLKLILRSSIEDSNNVIEGDGETTITIFDPDTTFDSAAGEVMRYLLTNKLLK